MSESRIAMCTFLFLLTILSATINLASVHASNLAVEWEYQNTNPPYYDPVERNYQQACCQSINNRYNLAGGWSTWNAYWDPTTEANVISAMQWRQQNNAGATYFWVGDYTWSYVNGVKHYNSYVNGGYIRDSTIYLQT